MKVKSRIRNQSSPANRLSTPLPPPSLPHHDIPSNAPPGERESAQTKLVPGNRDDLLVQYRQKFLCIARPIMSDSSLLRIGYVPEHFSTPLHFAQKYFGLVATLVAFPSGTGHMIQAIKALEIDVAIGLTEGWVAGLAQEHAYRLVGTYVETPLRWAISTGANRTDVNSAADLRSSPVGVSRLGSGSHIMSSVLADEHGWLAVQDGTDRPATSEPKHPFTIVPLQTFAELRRGVNEGIADFFLWEHFTTKRYHDSGEIKRVGDIAAPWPSWLIVASSEAVPEPENDERLDALFCALDQGIAHFEAHPEEAVRYISSELDYSAEDATAWLDTVKFTKGVRGVSPTPVEKTVEILKKAGVLDKQVGEEAIRAMIGARRQSR